MIKSRPKEIRSREWTLPPSLLRLSDPRLSASICLLCESTISISETAAARNPLSRVVRSRQKACRLYYIFYMYMYTCMPAMIGHGTGQARARENGACVSCRRSWHCLMACGEQSSSLRLSFLPFFSVQAMFTSSGIGPFGARWQKGPRLPLFRLRRACHDDWAVVVYVRVYSVCACVADGLAGCGRAGAVHDANRALCYSVATTGAVAAAAFAPKTYHTTFACTSAMG